MTEPQVVMVLSIPPHASQGESEGVLVVCEGDVARLVMDDGQELQFVRSELAGALAPDMSGRRAA